VSLTGRIVNGALAGAAGTTALNAVTYLDMSLRGRPSSSTPEASIEKLAEKASVQIPGDEETRQNRVSGLGALNGLVTGVIVGATLGALGAGRRGSQRATAAAAMLTAMVSANASMASLGVTDPREWSASDWASDAVPHLAYGWVTASALRKLGGPGS
jgi:hypothetical protein